MAKITNKDIAQRAGVSPAAVSLAIHGKKGISEATRTHILNVVREMDYVPPVRVRSGQLRSIVLLLGEPDEPMLPAVVQALLQLSRETGGQLRILPMALLQNGPAELLAGCDLLVTFDGLERAALEALSPLVQQILIIDGNFARKPFWNIRVDYEGAAYALTRALTEIGHRSFIYLNDDLQLSKNLICFSGFQKLILELHLPLNPAQIIMYLNRDPNIWSHVPDIIHNFNVSAIVCTSDRAAVETVERLRQAGFRVPEDISVAAIVSGEATRHPGFSFTQLSLGNNTVEEELRKLLLRAVSTDEYVDVLIPYSPVVRGQSTAAPRFDPTQKKLVIMLHLKNHPSLRIVRAGFLNRIQQMGYQAEVVGIEGDNPQEYFAALEQLANEPIDGLVSWLSAPGVFERFRRRGIPVVSLHSPSRKAEGYGEKARISADPVKIAEEVATYFAARLHDRTGALAVSQSGDNMLESTITQALIEKMREKCPNITVRHDFDFVDQDCTQMLTDYIRRTPELLGVFTTAGFACVNWAEAKRAANRRELLLVGTDYSDESIHLVETGEVGAFIAQPLYEEGQMGVVALDAILRGNPFPASCTLDAPLVTRENLEKYRRLLQDVKNWYA